MSTTLSTPSKAWKCGLRVTYKYRLGMTLQAEQLQSSIIVTSARDY